MVTYSCLADDGVPGFDDAVCCDPDIAMLLNVVACVDKSSRDVWLRLSASARYLCRAV